MYLKGIFTKKSSFVKLGILFLLMVISVLIHIFLAEICIMLFTDSKPFSINGMGIESQSTINSLKFIQLFSSIGLFITPLFLFSYLCDFNFGFNSSFSRQTFFLVTAIIFLIQPFISFIYEWNIGFNFPEWMLIYDQRAEQLTEHFLRMSNFGDLMLNLLVLAIIPAIGEELLFRGYLQKSIFYRIENEHIAIILTAILFSAIHMQFQGFLPRFILGLLLGYLFYWSGSLWVSIIAHFLNNATVVILSYPVLSDYTHFIQTPATTQQAFFSIFSVGFLLFLLSKSFSIKKLNNQNSNRL